MMVVAAFVVSAWTPLPTVERMASARTRVWQTAPARSVATIAAVVPVVSVVQARNVTRGSVARRNVV